jgi:hypothetical protein
MSEKIPIPTKTETENRSIDYVNSKSDSADTKKGDEPGLDLEKLLSYENPNAGEIDEVVRQEEKEERQFNTRDLYHDHTSKWIDQLIYEKNEEKEQYSSENLEKVKNVMKEFIEGKILVDLGGGERYYKMEKLANSCGASSYLCVDKYQYDGNKFRSNEGVMRVRMDMLRFVSRLPDNSVNFTISGIDGYVLPDRDYKEALAHEMARTTLQNGIVFGNVASIYGYLEHLFGHKQAYQIFENYWRTRNGRYIEPRFGFDLKFFIYKKVEEYIHQTPLIKERDKGKNGRTGYY